MRVGVPQIHPGLIAFAATRPSRSYSGTGLGCGGGDCECGGACGGSCGDGGMGGGCGCGGKCGGGKKAPSYSDMYRLPNEADMLAISAGLADVTCFDGSSQTTVYSSPAIATFPQGSCPSLQMDGSWLCGDGSSVLDPSQCPGAYDLGGAGGGLTTPSTQPGPAPQVPAGTQVLYSASVNAGSMLGSLLGANTPATVTQQATAAIAANVGPALSGVQITNNMGVGTAV